MAWLAFASTTSPGRTFCRRYSTTSSAAWQWWVWQPFLPGCFGHGCAQRAVSHQLVGGIGSPFAGLAVAGFTGSAKFQHIAQHGNAAAAGAGLAVMQNLQGCFHAVRAGVIAILNKGHTAVLHNVLAHTGGLIAGQRTAARARSSPKRVAAV